MKKFSCENLTCTASYRNSNPHVHPLWQKYIYQLFYIMPFFLFSFRFSSRSTICFTRIKTLAKLPLFYCPSPVCCTTTVQWKYKEKNCRLIVGYPWLPTDALLKLSGVWVHILNNCGTPSIWDSHSLEFGARNSRKKPSENRLGDSPPL